MSNKNRRGGLGRGLGALIPTAPPNDEATEGGRAMGYPSMPPYDAGVDHQSGYVAAAVPVVSAEPDEDTRRGTESDDAANGAVPDPPDAPSAANPATSPVARSGDAATTTADGLLPVAGAHFVNVPVESIRPNPKQPRQVFDEQALEELTHSIREFGVLQPIVVRAVEMHATDGGADGEGIGDLTGARYELVMGERRLRAAIGAGLTDVPAIVRTTADDAMLRDALLENIHRAQLNPLEEAAAYQQLLEEFGATHDELAVRIGRSRPQVSNTIRLLNLPVPVQRRVAAGILSAGHARALLSVDDSEVQEDLAGRIVAEGLSVRATEELVALHGQGHGSRKRPRKVPGPRITAPALAELADRLSDAFDTRVKVDLGRSKGKITVEFATIDDLERIVGVMSGQLSAHPTHPMHDVGAAFARVEEPAAPDHAGDDTTERPDDAGTGEPAAVRPSDAVASPPAGPAAPTASDTGEGYSGWGSDHVPDLGAWDERIRYDPNES